MQRTRFRKNPNRIDRAILDRLRGGDPELARDSDFERLCQRKEKEDLIREYCEACVRRGGGASRQVTEFDAKDCRSVSEEFLREVQSQMRCITILEAIKRVGVPPS
jgi:hypothetical protein